MDPARAVRTVLTVAVGVLGAAGPIAAAAVSEPPIEPLVRRPGVVAASDPGVLDTIAVTVEAAAASTPRSPEPPGATELTERTAPRVVLWGDSLGWEAADAFRLGVHSAGATAEVRTFGGTAPCDWLGDIDSRARRPLHAALLEFAGNALTSCMRDGGGDPITGPALVDKYQADLGAAIDVLTRRGVRVYLVAPPPPRPDHDDGQHAALLAAYRTLADEHPEVWLLDAGTAVTEGGAYADALPCLPWEGEAEGCASGSIRVRADDGRHFCPVVVRAEAGVVEACPVWSSGAFRFGMAMAEPVVVRSGPAQGP